MKPFHQSATEVRKNFSECIDLAVHERPQFVSRTRDGVVLIGERFFDDLLETATIHCTFEDESGGGYILTNEEISDIIASGKTKPEAMHDLAEQLLEYAAEYYENYSLYSRSPNRKAHIPYVLRILTLAEPNAVEGIFECRDEKN